MDWPVVLWKLELSSAQASADAVHEHPLRTLNQDRTASDAR
jgi:hypothetical protein